MVHRWISLTKQPLTRLLTYTFSPVQSVSHPAAQVAFSEKGQGRVCLIRVNSFLYDRMLRAFLLLLSVVNLWERPDSWFAKLTWLWALYSLFWDALINISADTRVSWSTIRVMILQSGHSAGFPHPLTASPFYAFFLAVLSSGTYSSYPLFPPPHFADSAWARPPRRLTLPPIVLPKPLSTLHTLW